MSDSLIWLAHDGGQEKIGSLFAEARSPTVVFLDELGALLPSRTRGPLEIRSDMVL
jgi:SpoVK/Ycf46/Vps4 family AAA+-type ATPase